MENLFDDDILLDDNDATSAFNNVAVTSLSNLVNDNLNYLKFNSYINDDIIAKYRQVQQDMQISLFANTYPDFYDCDNITFNIFSILKDLRY